MSFKKFFGCFSFIQFHVGTVVNGILLDIYKSFVAEHGLGSRYSVSDCFFKNKLITSEVIWTVKNFKFEHNFINIAFVLSFEWEFS